MARFGQAPKASKPPQQLSQALEPHTPPQQLSKASCLPPQQLSKACRLLGHGTSLGPASCFYWASKLLCGTFWAGPKSLETSAAAFEGLRALELQNPLQQLSKASRLLGHGTSLGPTSCFYWASKLLCGTFWAGPQSLKTSAAAFAKACRLLGHGTSLGPTSCFYWASKLPCGTFWAGPKSFNTSAAAFEGLRTSQPSAAAFEGVPLAWPWYLPRPHKLFLLGFETAMWHVLKPQKPQNLRSSFRRR